jgi:hypothetical protein
MNYTRSPRASRGSINGSANGYYNSPARSARRTVRVSQNGSIGHTEGLMRSPKRVIAAEESPSGQRGFSPSLDRPTTERVTVYERDPVVVSIGRPSGETYVPAINVVSPNKTTVTPIVREHSIQPVEVFTDRISHAHSPRYTNVAAQPTTIR